MCAGFCARCPKLVLNALEVYAMPKPVQYKLHAVVFIFSAHIQTARRDHILLILNVE